MIIVLCVKADLWLQFLVLSQLSNMFWFLSPFSLKEDGAGTPYDKESTAIIKLNNTTVLYLKEVTKFLALVCFVREESFERKGNCVCVCDHLVLLLSREFRNVF